MKTKSQRISISGRNLQFLKELAQDMDENSLTEVLSYLLADVRLLGYKIGDKVSSQYQPQPRQTQSHIGYAFDPSTFEPAFTPLPANDHDRNHVEVDPIIARMSQLIEDF